MSDVMGVASGRADARSSAIRDWFRIPPPTERVATWHVSPAIDMAAYHFSWLWILIPLLLSGIEFPRDYALLYVVTLTFSFVHRHYTLGYAYLDRDTFAQHRARFIWTPVLLFAALIVTPYLLRARLDPGWISIGGFEWPDSSLRLKPVVTTVVFVAGVWNIWHVLSQKYGIMRIYSAKSQSEGSPGVPGWVDRLFIMGWLPLIVAYLVPRFAEAIYEEFHVAKDFLEPIVKTSVAVEPIAVPVASLIAIAGVTAFFTREWRINRFRNRPRLSMGVGMFALWGAFLVVDPVKVYLAFAFSHGVEYMVFVWAFQRRRYAETREPKPVMARLLEHPWLAYVGYTVALSAIYVLFRDWDDLSFWHVTDERAAGMKVGKWVFYWGVFQSLQHFYFDGFLWKTRQRTVRESL